MRQTAETAKKLQGLRHETSHILVVTLLKDRLEQLKRQLIDAEDVTWKQIQGRAQECREMLRQMTGDHPSKLA